MARTTPDDCVQSFVFRWTEHVLSPDAQDVLREWLDWSLLGALDSAGTIALIRSELEALGQP